MIQDILNNMFQINEAKDIKKDSFKYFFIDEIKDIDKIIDAHDLGDMTNIEVMLITDGTYEKDDPGKGEWFKINTEDILKFMEVTVDKYEDGDYLDFGGSYTLETCVRNFIEVEYEAKAFKSWDDFIGTMDGSVGNDLNKLSELNEYEIRPDRVRIRIKPPTKDQLHKWYYKDKNKWALERPLVVRNSENPDFPNHWTYPPSDSGGGYYISKDNAEVID